ncbi:putative oligopeptidase B [Helianthus annuus]|nr:putative oligopeptidase B [Helianthus annuus]
MISLFPAAQIRLGVACVRLSQRFRSKASMAKAPPVAKKVKHEMEMFGDVRVDNYYWLRDDSRSNPEILSHLQQENAYTDAIISENKHLEDDIYAEIRGRIKEDDITAPVRKGLYYYYERTLEGKEYVQHCRRLAQEDAVSPNHKLVAYAEDTKGDEIYTIHVIDAETRSPVGEPLVGVTDNIEWVGDEALLYVTMDEILRPYKVWFHKLHTNQSTDSCFYHEKDDMFSLDLEASESKKYLFVGSESKTTRCIFYLDISKPEKGLMVLTPRLEGIDTSVSHRGNHFFIKRRSNEAYNSELVACPLNDVNATTMLLPHRESLQGGQTVDFIDPVYSVEPEESQFSSTILRFSYSSLRTPPSTYDYDMNTGVSVLKKVETILGGFDSSKYVTKREWAIAKDGTHVPISIAYRKDLVKLDGSDPLLLYGYGSYEMCVDPRFKASRLSLLDRGFTYAIAHIRGGGEMGRKWYENGKYLHKKNTFTDFIDSAEYLIEKKYCTKEKLCIEGRSAGGLLIGAVEWGDPRKEEFYHYMKSYSPVDNVKAQNYPAILVTAGLNDPRVQYFEPAKFVAKLREMKTDKNLLLFKCEMGAGHFSKSGR